MTDNTKIIIIADDFFYLKGVASYFKVNSIFEVIEIHVDNDESSFPCEALNFYSPHNSIILLAVEDFTKIKLIPDLNLRAIICSIRCPQESPRPFLFNGVLFLNRDVKARFLLIAIQNFINGHISRDMKFSPSELKLILNYFSANQKSAIQTLLNFSDKKLSYYKRSVYAKVMTNSDSGAYPIFKAIGNVYDAVNACRLVSADFISHAA